jgi:hypothetical protein
LDQYHFDNIGLYSRHRSWDLGYRKKQIALTHKSPGYDQGLTYVTTFRATKAHLAIRVGFSNLSEFMKQETFTIKSDSALWDKLNMDVERLSNIPPY